ncbi:response regulator [Agrobacterium larrymoorei]|uniref:response regulator n=1 Tax=Agrobacterium larrymoorei TaxID=160699 RepID=UPI001572B9BC|nr:response regulator [Agrobacterium larrymoorei]NTJ41033.1 response regulator [Agrobacterium larrymoorei]
MRIMIVEDEALLALELESEIEAAGHSVIGIAAASWAARDLVDRESPDFAFVDIHLVDGPTGVDVGRYLTEKNIPYVFVSGNIKRIPDDFAGAVGAIEKPYTVNGLQNALDYLHAKLSGDRSATVPPNLILPERV